MWVLEELEKIIEEESMWMPEARAMAAQCWCTKETRHLEMIPDLAEEFAKQLSYWIDIAAQNERNTEYYRNLLIKCGEILEKEAYISDDGSVQDDVLCAKIPELVKKRQEILENIYDMIDNNISFF